MYLLIESVGPRAHDIVEVVVPGGLPVLREVAELGVVNGIQDRVDRVVVVPGHPASAEEPGGGGSLVPRGHVVAGVDARLHGPLVIELHAAEDAGLCVCVVSEQNGMRAQVVARRQLASMSGGEM